MIILPLNIGQDPFAQPALDIGLEKRTTVFEIAAHPEARRVLPPGGVLLAAAIGRLMAVLDWAQNGGLIADVAAKLVPVLSTGVHDPILGFTDAAFHRRSTAARGGAGRVCRRARPGH